jgi:peroxiredoxin
MRDGAVRAVVFAGLLAVARAAACDEGFLPGHSHYGEAFDRGPRQSAYLMGGTGKVHFPVSAQDPLVQKFIEQGIGQLHGFWFVEAERSFRQAARIDPNCGIACWGMSLANQVLNPVRAKQFAVEAAKHRAGLSERERMYIDALGNENGYRAILAKYPKDLEAKAFEVWRLWHKSESGAGQDGDLEDAMRLAHEILSVDPMHPIHHAVIHIADATKTYGRGLASAGKCGDAAPSIGHMWHMPTHIYYALKRYPEAAWQLEASLRTENARARHDRTVPYQVQLYAHNNEWLVRTLMHLGRVHDARRIARNMIDLPRHPLFNLIEAPDEEAAPQDSTQERPKEIAGTSASYGREGLMQVLRQYEYWDDLIELCRAGYIEPTGLPAEQGKIHANLAIADYCRGNVADGDKELAALRKLLNDQVAARNGALDEVTKRPEWERTGARSSVDARFAGPISRLSRQADDLENYHRIVTEFYIDRTMLIAYLAALFAGEMVVFWLLRRRIVRALLTVLVALLAGAWIFQHHLALLNLPYDAVNVDFALVCRTLLQAGDFDEAEWSARNFAKERSRQVRPQANLVEILYKAGKMEDVRAEFAVLRELAGTADLDSPPLARLEPIAREIGFPTDWRLPQKIHKSLAGRRSLPSLGPLLWRPWSAPDWRLKDAQGKEHRLAEFHGKPVLMLFFLGNGCLHCKQQLEAFAKRAGQFSEAGLTVIAVSTDDQQGIKKSLETYGPQKFPFLMLADPGLKVFQSYRAYDDFEQIALHGTFSIDREGFIRWHDVGSEPFMDVDFVLSESNRLLSRPVAPVEPLARVIAGVN